MLPAAAAAVPEIHFIKYMKINIGIGAV